MTLYEAYLKAKDDFENPSHEGAKKPANTFLHGCHDYAEFWTFFFAPTPYDPDNFLTWYGSADTMVNKKTGELGTFSPAIEPELYERLHKKAKKITLEQILTGKP